jgi:rhomboid family GlyGly-CTERM serine protease
MEFAAAVTAVVGSQASSNGSDRLVNSHFKNEGGHGGVTLPWRTFLLTAGAVAAYLLCGAAPEAWVWDRAAIAQGEWWRLITGHWVHSDLAHAGWDCVALLLLGILFEARLRWHLPLALLFGTFGIDVWLWWGEPALRYYCGLSGILNSLLVLGLLQLWLDLRHPVLLLTAIAAASKIIIEIHAGQALLVQTAWPSVPTVHAAGYLIGLILAWGFVPKLAICSSKEQNESGFTSQAGGSI